MVGSASRAWKIKVTQFLCSDTASLPPSGCMQWHTGVTGTVKQTTSYSKFDTLDYIR